MQPGVRRTGWRNDGCDSRVLGRGRCRSGCPAGRLPVLPGPRAPCAGCGARWSPPGAPLISVSESVLIFFVTGEDSKDLDGVGRVDFRGIWKYFEMKMICHVEEWSQGGPRGAHVSALEQRGVCRLRGAASGHPRHLSGRVRKDRAVVGTVILRHIGLFLWVRRLYQWWKSNSGRTLGASAQAEAAA